MSHDYRPLLELAMNISDNVGYASSHLQQLCILEGDIGLKLNELKHDSAWLDGYFDAPKAPRLDSYREALLTIMRNMIFRLAKHPEPLQWQYDSRQHLAMYNTLLLIDSAAKLWHFTPSAALDGFAPPLFDDLQCLVTWLLDDFADATILPWSYYYTETDRTNELILLDDGLAQTATSERLTGYLLYRQDVLDHISGNQPIGKEWIALTEPELSTALHGAMSSNDLSRIPDLLRQVLDGSGVRSRASSAPSPSPSS